MKDRQSCNLVVSEQVLGHPYSSPDYHSKRTAISVHLSPPRQIFLNFLNFLFCGQEELGDTRLIRFPDNVLSVNRSQSQPIAANRSACHVER